MDASSKFHSPKLNWSVLVWACFALLSLNALAFIVFTAAPYIQADVFRHLQQIVLPFLSGQEGLSILWSNHHPSPLLHLIQIANLKFLGFRLDYEAYLGFFFQILTTLLILKNILSTTALENRNIGFTEALYAVLIASILFGFNTIQQYLWPLLTTVQYLYFFGIVVFISVDKCIHDESWNRHLIVAFASLAFMFANADYGTIFLASMITTSMLVYLIERRSVYLRATLVLAAAWIAYRLFMLAILPTSLPRPPTNLVALVQPLLMHPLQTFTQFSIGLSSGLVNINFLQNHFPDAAFFLTVVSLLLTLIFVATFIVYLKNKLFHVSMMPLALMLVAVFFTIPVFLYRQFFIGDDIWSLAAPRYIPTFKLAIIGMLWALWLILRERALVRGEPLRWPYRAIGVLSIATILFIQGVQIRNGWKYVDHMRWMQDNYALALFLAGKPLENTIEVPRDIVKGNTNYYNVLAYLERNKLNVFADNFPRGRLLDEHVQSRKQFYALDPAIRVGEKNGEFGKILGKTGTTDATWELLPQRLVVDNKAGRALYIRVVVSADSASEPGTSLIAVSGNSPASNINLSKGKQTLFFSLKQGEQLRINAPPTSTIDEIELRSSI